MGILIGLIKKSREVYCWCNWHEDDGDYFKIEKKSAIEGLKNYLNRGITPVYHITDGILYIG
jgi:hypothetical protein